MHVEFCKFLGTMKGGTITLTPLGKVRNGVKKPMLAGWDKITTKIIINQRYARGLDGIEDYSHIIVVYWMNKEAHCHLKHHPQGRADVPYVGIFSCRCPQRPNPIAISTVKLLSRKGNVLTVRGLDILDGTPVIDVKPYTPRYDAVKNGKTPAWIERLAG